MTVWPSWEYRVARQRKNRILPTKDNKQKCQWSRVRPTARGEKKGTVLTLSSKINYVYATDLPLNRSQSYTPQLCVPAAPLHATSDCAAATPPTNNICVIKSQGIGGTSERADIPARLFSLSLFNIVPSVCAAGELNRASAQTPIVTCSTYPAMNERGRKGFHVIFMRGDCEALHQPFPSLQMGKLSQHRLKG